jgi:hypothetical protein
MRLGNWIQGRPAQVALGALAVVLVAAVPALGLTTLGGDFFPAGQASERAEVAVASASPLTFDAPAVSLRKVHPAGKRESLLASVGGDDAYVLDDFRFTANLTYGQLLSQDLLNLSKSDPVVFAFFVSQILPTLTADFFAFYRSLPPFEQIALVTFITIFMNSPSPVAGPSPPPASGNK